MKPKTLTVKTVSSALPNATAEAWCYAAKASSLVVVHIRMADGQWATAQLRVPNAKARAALEGK